MSEVNLLDLYPRSKRPIEERGQLITEEHRKTARQFSQQYFDGDRLYGYGGYNYHPRFWTDTVRRFRDYYQLAEDAAVLFKAALIAALFKQRRSSPQPGSSPPRGSPSSAGGRGAEAPRAVEKAV
jgi:hypothetical protein